MRRPVSVCEPGHTICKKVTVVGQQRALAKKDSTSRVKINQKKNQQFDQFVNGLISETRHQASTKRFPKIGMEQA